MQLLVPEKKPRAKAQKVPPMGHHEATLMAIGPGEEGVGEDLLSLEWRFTAEKRRWTMEHILSVKELVALLHSHGHTGPVETDHLLGQKYRIFVRTRGGRTSAFVESVEPLAP